MSSRRRSSAVNPDVVGSGGDAHSTIPRAALDAALGRARAHRGDRLSARGRPKVPCSLGPTATATLHPSFGPNPRVLLGRRQTTARRRALSSAGAWIGARGATAGVLEAAAGAVAARLGYKTSVRAPAAAAAGATAATWSSSMICAPRPNDGECPDTSAPVPGAATTSGLAPLSDSHSQTPRAARSSTIATSHRPRLRGGSRVLPMLAPRDATELLLTRPYALTQP